MRCKSPTKNKRAWLKTKRLDFVRCNQHGHVSAPLKTGYHFCHFFCLMLALLSRCYKGQPTRHLLFLNYCHEYKNPNGSNANKQYLYVWHDDDVRPGKKSTSLFHPKSVSDCPFQIQLRRITTYYKFNPALRSM